jgi:hypothetical protein
VGRVIRIHLIAAGAAAVLAGTACHSPVSEHFGEAYLAAKAQQTANPAAGSEPADPNPGLDGTTVDRALEEYRKPLSEQTGPQQESTILQITN